MRRSATREATAAGASATCATCRHFCGDPHEIERRLPGLTILSSAWGDCRGDAGICALHDRYLLPFHTCPDHAPAPPPPRR